MRFEPEQKGPEIRTGNMVNDQDVRDLTRAFSFSSERHPNATVYT